ncbi:hypothetical protein [Reichenbachiella faecimaris]|uniref:hypothetical protein n=1 Tax=Reichenbachiella faecimaris TaxID=692418 RepID=UPI000A01BB74|nr:hypothetical protein [Reichenbachiella faecimaris]
MILQIAGIGKLFVGFINGEIGYVSCMIICTFIVELYIYKGGALADAKTDMAKGIFMSLDQFCLLFGWILY